MTMTAEMTEQRYRESLTAYVLDHIERDEALAAAQACGFSDRQFDRHVERLRRRKSLKDSAERASKLFERKQNIEAQLQEERLEIEHFERIGVTSKRIHDMQTECSRLNVSYLRACQESSDDEKRLVRDCDPAITQELKQVNGQIRANDNQSEVTEEKRRNLLIFDDYSEAGKGRVRLEIEELRERAAKGRESIRSMKLNPATWDIPADKLLSVQTDERTVREYDELGEKLRGLSRERNALVKRKEELEAQRIDWKSIPLD